MRQLAALIALPPWMPACAGTTTSAAIRGSFLAAGAGGREEAPVCAWPQSLEMAIRIMPTSRQPIWIGWGGELTEDGAAALAALDAGAPRS